MSKKVAQATPPARSQAPTVSPLDAARPWLYALVLLAVAVTVFNHFGGVITRTDFWWHLKTGVYIWQHQSLPVPDPFAYTTYLGKPAYPGEELTRYFNLTHEWLAQVIFYLLYKAGGPTAVILFRQTMLAGLCGIIGLLVYRRCGGVYRAVCAVLAAVPLVAFLSGDRPFLITYFLLGVTLLILEFRRPLWLLPPLFLFWANCHSGFFMGLVVVGAYCAEALFLRWRGKRVPDERRLATPQGGCSRLLLVAAASLLAAGLNPNGYRVFQVLLLYRNSPLQMQIFEWQHPNPWEFSSFSVILYGAAAVLLWARRRVRLSDWIVYLIFAVSALSAARNVILMGIIGPLVIFSYLPWKWRLPVLVDAAAMVLFAYVFWINFPRAFTARYGIQAWEMPSGAADFLLAHHIQGRMFNTYDDGGYLIWRLSPQLKVFIDGRALNETAAADSKRIAFNANAVGGPTGQQLLEKYGIDFIVMPMLDGLGSVYYLPAALADPVQKTWKLVYRDGRSVIFVKNVPEGLQPLNSLEALTAMETQCRQMLDYTGYSRCANSVSHVFAVAGDQVRAAQWLNTYRESGKPDSPMAGK